jgi:hypothetical protein
LNTSRNAPLWFDKPALSLGEGLTTSGAIPFALSLSKGEVCG